MRFHVKTSCLFVCQRELRVPKRSFCLVSSHPETNTVKKLISFHSNGVESAYCLGRVERLRYDLRIFVSRKKKSKQASQEQRKSNFSSSHWMLRISTVTGSSTWLLSPRQTNNSLTWCQYFDLSINGNNYEKLTFLCQASQPEKLLLLEHAVMLILLVLGEKRKGKHFQFPIQFSLALSCRCCGVTCESLIMTQPSIGCWVLNGI